MEIIPQKVKVRKYEVDLESLKLFLKNYKVRSKLSNKQIAERLKVPITMVEHWFRGDKSFSIPDENLWLDLKLILGIKEDIFDKQVMKFEIKDGVFEKSNRVYDEEGIAPTLTCGNAGNEKIKVRGGYMSEPKLVGGIGEINFGKQFRQGNRVYDSEEIAMCLLAQPVGNAGGYSYLYKTKDRENKGSMWKNNLERLEFKDNKLKLVSLFSGIGAFEKSLTKLGIDYELTNFAEVDIDAIISYGAIHIKEQEFDYPSDEEMKSWLMERNIGYDFATGKSKIPRLKKDKLLKLYKTCILGNNLGDVSKIKYTQKDIDLVVGGSPCQDFSIAGKLNGSVWTCKECDHQYNPIEQHFNKRDCCPQCESEDLDKTRSSLLVEYLRSIRELRPKYFIYENVKNIKGGDFLKIFNLFEKELSDYGYRTFNKVLNSKNYGVAQNRERVFVVGIRNDIGTEFEFQYGFDSGIRLKDILDDNVDEKYYIESLKSKNLIETFSRNNKLKEKTKDGFCICEQRSDEGLRFFKDEVCGTLRTIDSCGDKRIIENGAIRGRYNQSGNIEQQLELRDDEITNTLTTVEKDNVVVEEEFRIRKLTPLEAYRLMGFDDEDFYKAKELGVSDSALYKQSGNSIVVNVLYYIFKNLLIKN